MFRPRVFLAGTILALAVLAAAAQTAKERVAYPEAFRSAMAHYATVDRADGKVYELFVNQPALEAWRRDRQLPAGAVFVIESFLAERRADGAFARDAAGRLVKGASENEIHVAEKQATWAPNGECTSPSLMNGRPMASGSWRAGAFDPRNGQRIVRASHPPGECHQCHTDRRGEDFILSRGLLDSFAASGRTSTISFMCGEREICFGGPPKPLSSPLPACEATFRP
jgi:hypothetical protein